MYVYIIIRKNYIRAEVYERKQMHECSSLDVKFAKCGLVAIYNKLVTAAFGAQLQLSNRCNILSTKCARY